MVMMGSLRIYEAEELAERLGVSYTTILRYTTTGRLKGRKFGNRWMYLEESIKEFFIEGETGGIQKSKTVSREDSTTEKMVPVIPATQDEMKKFISEEDFEETDIEHINI